ncbi:DNA ligase I, putative, partial [Plasmodium ovale curtisi]
KIKSSKMDKIYFNILFENTWLYEFSYYNDEHFILLENDNKTFDNDKNKCITFLNPSTIIIYSYSVNRFNKKYWKSNKNNNIIPKRLCPNEQNNCLNLKKNEKINSDIIMGSRQKLSACGSINRGKIYSMEEKNTFSKYGNMKTSSFSTKDISSHKGKIFYDSNNLISYNNKASEFHQNDKVKNIDLKNSLKLKRGNINFIADRTSYNEHDEKKKKKNYTKYKTLRNIIQKRKNIELCNYKNIIYEKSCKDKQILNSIYRNNYYKENKTKDLFFVLDKNGEQKQKKEELPYQFNQSEKKENFVTCNNEGNIFTKEIGCTNGDTKSKGKNENEIKKGSLFNCKVYEDEKISDLASPKFNPANFDISNLCLPEKDKAKHKFKDSLLFTFLTNTFNQIEELKGSGAGSKKNVAIILSNVFRVLIYYSPNDLIPAVYITLNKVAPDYQNVEAGVGEALILKTMSEAYSRTEASIKKDLQQIEDLGIIAESCSCKMRTIFPLPRLTIQSVFNELKSIPNISGSNSQQKKREVIKKLLVSAKTSEAKYIVRFLQQRLRIGVNSATVLQALAYAFVLTRPELPENIIKEGKMMNEKLLNESVAVKGDKDNCNDNATEIKNENNIKLEKKNDADNKTNALDTDQFNDLVKSIKMRNERMSKPNLFYNIGKEGDTRLLPIFKELKNAYCDVNNDSDIFECMEKSVKSALCELPNIEMIIQNLLNGDDMNVLMKKCTVKTGVPVQPMLAKPTKGIQEVLDRFNNVTFTCEYKYDGERAQIHYIDKDNIKIFSRNLETMTEKYPDVIQIVKDQIMPGVTESIIDSEVVAYDIENKKILPFQILTTRKRKDVDIENIKVKICLFPFDLICCNGVPVIKEPLEIRRKLLYSLLKCKEGVLEYATHSEMNNIEDIDIFLQDAIENN